MPRVNSMVLAIVLLAGSLFLASPLTGCAASDRQRSPAKPATSEKASRTPAQQKINSQILYEIYRRRGQAKEKNVPPGPTGLRLDEKDRALVDVRVTVTPTIEKMLRDAGSTIVSASREYRTVIAWIPLLEIERIAGDSSVQAIEPAAEAATHK
jgi:hypothetical protein